MPTLPICNDMRFFNKKKRKIRKEISFDEILLDASNLPSFDVQRMEGHMELQLARKNIYMIGIFFIIVAIIFFVQIYKLQVVEGVSFRDRSENNSVNQTLIVAERGAIYDRTGELIAWNEIDLSGEYDFPVRAYTDRNGLGPFIGYVSYPKKDSSGNYFRTKYLGISGVEKEYNNLLSGVNGRQFVEVNVLGEVIAENIVSNSSSGGELKLSIDIELSEAMYNLVATTSLQNGFRSAGAVIMDIYTGEILALTSFPSYDPEVLADGDDVEAINALNNDNRFPFLNKIIGGLYTPGSIVKPFMAYAALVENIIDPMKIIYSNGSLILPNQYDPNNPTIFKDWRVQGAMTMRDAIAYSSNVYFYIIGGGFEDQEGLGIARINKYMKMFGLGEKTGISLGGEMAGVVPSPEWKQKVFGDDWRLGDTYHTSIGQFGYQVTPLQMVRAFASLANGGKLVTPTVLFEEQGDVVDLNLKQDAIDVVTEGMRRAVVQDRGTARPFERSDVKIAGKSGTAEVGVGNAFVNSWAAGYFPYEEPRYAFILFMEHGPRSNTVGATTVMGKVFDWMAENKSEYFEQKKN